MSVENRLLRLLTVHEGFRLNSYKDDKGYLTVFYGWCIEKRPASPIERRIIQDITGNINIPFGVGDHENLGAYFDRLPDAKKKAIGLAILKSMAMDTIEECETQLGYWPDLDDNRAAAIADVCYNMSVYTFIQFKLTNAAMVAGDFKTASEMLLDSDYHRDLVKLRPYPEFILRSERIANMIKTGEWPADIEEPKD